jgi:hypothetical protein
MTKGRNETPRKQKNKKQKDQTAGKYRTQRPTWQSGETLVG